jgi:hypothetical protein
VFLLVADFQDGIGFTGRRIWFDPLMRYTNCSPRVADGIACIVHGLCYYFIPPWAEVRN